MTRLWIVRALQVSVGLVVVALLSFGSLAPVAADLEETGQTAALVPSRPHPDEDSPEALAFAEPSLAEDWQLRAAVFLASSLAVFAAGMWMGRKTPRADWVRGYVGPLDQTPHISGKAEIGQRRPRGNAIL